MNVYECNKCGRIVEEIKEGVGKPYCCGQQMILLEPGTSDGVYEKHIPITKISGTKVIVNVGAEDHPMTCEHYIEWIAIETTNGMQIKKLKPNQKPMAVFHICESEKITATYAYCNLHKLWQSTSTVIV